MIRAGIYGASGYAGLELYGIIRRHPEVECVFATSESHAGRRLSEVHPCPYEQELVAPAEASLRAADVVFTCTPHAASAPLVRAALEAGARCIDLSADLRLRDAAVYAQWYGPHPAPELLAEAVFGLTEVYRSEIVSARVVANPGCYPTGPLLALQPLLAAGIVSSERVIIDAKSGVSGAGVTPTAKTHFCSVHGNFAAYNVGHSHRHVPEMEQELARYAGEAVRVVFAPHLLPVSRGILSTIYVQVDAAYGPDEVLELWRERYRGEPFIQVLDAGGLATLAHVVHSNRCALSAASAGAPGELILVTALDNLVKGAAGQAMQNMNAMFGLDETLGLVS